MKSLTVLILTLLVSNTIFGQSAVPEPKLEFLFEEKVALEPAQELGTTTYGIRKIINIVGGTFEGPKLKGKILPGGADWQTVRTDGTADLVAQYTLQTDDGALIYIVNKGIRHASPEILERMAKGEFVDPSEYYMRTAATFETSHKKYKWLNNIIAVASGALYHQGQPVTKVLDMVNTLEPVAGKFALTLFFFGTLSAGLSSIFPCLLIAPILLADYQFGELDTSSKQFRIITAMACLFALIVPVFGANPIEMQIMSQVFNVFVLPVVIIGILLLINNKKIMRGHKTSIWINLGLSAALLFACLISYNGILALTGYF